MNFPDLAGQKQLRIRNSVWSLFTVLPVTCNSKECEAELSRLGGYIVEERGIVPMKAGLEKTRIFQKISCPVGFFFVFLGKEKVLGR
jgi:hypothetical protein